MDSLFYGLYDMDLTWKLFGIKWDMSFFVLDKLGTGLLPGCLQGLSLTVKSYLLEVCKDEAFPFIPNNSG
ncbi:hypothetical protein L1887_20758 [Cichorium endivia]|nr:hypothetical protein L1887_20758 [Cichorium endivia]